MTVHGSPRLSDPQRLRVLAASGLLDSAVEPCFDRFTRVAIRILGVPVALLSLVDSERQFLKSAAGLDASRSMPLSHSFCKHVVEDDEPLVVDDALEHPLVRDNAATIEDGVRAYAGVPVKAAGETLGAFCAVDYRPRQWTSEDVAVLQELAAACMDEIEQRVRDQRTRARWAAVSEDAC